MTDETGNLIENYINEICFILTPKIFYYKFLPDTQLQIQLKILIFIIKFYFQIFY